jgi:hypothetical protein
MDVMTATRLMVFSGRGVLYSLAFGTAFGIKALHRRRERQPSALPAAVDDVPVGLCSGAAPADTWPVMTLVQGDP